MISYERRHDKYEEERGLNYLLLLTGEREYGETVFPSSSDRALLALTEYYNANKYLTK